MTLNVGSDHVLVRMYNVGFGDCFLVVFPAPDRPRKVLIDCGSHSSGRGPLSIAEVAERVVADIADDDEVARIDLVIGTHRHQDHVSGFDNKIWRDVEVSEVWMPWTEHPTDPEARRIREKQSATAHALCLSLEAVAGAEAESALALARNSLTNAKAMETLHRGFATKARRRFLPDKTKSRNSFQTSLLPGVTVHALGPSRDEAVIRDMDPPVGGGYLRAAEAEGKDGQSPPPFRAGWAIKIEDFLRAEEFAHLRLSEKQMQRIDALSDADHLQIAAALEKAVNGTSLMLVFELGDAVLLFPGDAQWGTWNAVLADEGWRELLARTTFYKIGHHGSHNATPRAFVEEVIGARRPQPDAFVDNFRAAVSTRKMDMWKFIPKNELLVAIAASTPSLARSDLREPVPDFETPDEIVTETLIPTRP